MNDLAQKLIEELQCETVFTIPVLGGIPVSEAEGKITKTLILGSALAEATAIYGFVIALMIIVMLG